MANLNFNEKQLFERLFDRGGYVLDFSNRTFGEFFNDYNIAIYSDRFAKYGESKMKRLRAFWELEPDTKVGNVLSGLLEYAISLGEIDLKDSKSALFVISKLKGEKTQPIVKNEISEDEFLRKEFADFDLGSLGLESGLIEVLNQRIKEIQKGIQSKSSLSVLFLCGSSLEGILLGIATKNPKDYNQAKSSPKENNSNKVKQFSDWSLSDLINVSHEVGYLGLDVKKFSHVLRDFRNYIHPYEQWVSKFDPDGHTSEICWQVFKAAIHDIKTKK
jgi:hypothetical protein